LASSEKPGARTFTASRREVSYLRCIVEAGPDRVCELQEFVCLRQAGVAELARRGCCLPPTYLTCGAFGTFRPSARQENMLFPPVILTVPIIPISWSSAGKPCKALRRHARAPFNPSATDRHVMTVPGES